MVFTSVIWLRVQHCSSEGLYQAQNKYEEAFISGGERVCNKWTAQKLELWFEATPESEHENKRSLKHGLYCTKQKQLPKNTWKSRFKLKFFVNSV
jgi:hypothetical protein